jgi:hypothetical protein
MYIPDNLQFTAEQSAQLAGCCKDTIISHTEPAKSGSRFFIPSRRNGHKGTIKIMAGDLFTYLQRTQRGYLPGHDK